MKHLEDKALCPHCGGELHHQPYLMARRAEKNVLSLKQIAWGVVLILALVFVASVKAAPLSDGTTLFYGAPRLPPLRGSVTWAQQDQPGGGTQEILSLISDNSQTLSFAWPLFILLNATSSPAATGDSSQSTGAQVRLFNSSPGSPWASAFHAELFHGVDYPSWDASPAAAGTTIDYNAELTRESPLGTVLAFEANSVQQASNNGVLARTFPPDAAYNLAGPWVTGVRFDPASSGRTAVDVQGRWQTGLDLHGLNLSAGRIDASSIYLNGRPLGVQPPVAAPVPRVGRVVLAPGVFLDYAHGRIRLHRHGRVVARF